ncbi:outer membrane protein assembly factor BamD [bacterium]|nr:outer membrane protein assembly factor BamD [bacterium]
MILMKIFLSLPKIREVLLCTRLYNSLGLVVLTIGMSQLLVGCSSTSSKPVEEELVKEVPINGTPSIQGTEKELFASAKKVYAKNYLLVAQDSFRSIVENYPLGPYAEFASIKLADTSFIQLDFDEAAKLYEEALRNYPLSDSTPYIRMRAGRSFQLMNTDIGRDRDPIERAVEHYQEFLRRHPDSMFRPQVEAYLDEAYRSLAQHEKLVADFYERRGHQRAARKRHARYQKVMQQFGITEEKMLAENAPEEDVVKASLNPASKLAAAKLTTAELNKSEVKNTRLEKTREETSSSVSEQGQNPSEKSTSTSVLRPTSLRDVSCSVRGGKKVSIELVASPPASYVTEVGAPSSGLVTISLPATLPQAINLECFDGEPLSIGKDGVLRLESNSPFIAFQMDNPPRIILAEKQ